MLAVPLNIQERVIGVLTCLGPPGHVFTNGQETLLTTLANQTALAIENARLVTSAAVVTGLTAALFAWLWFGWPLIREARD